MFASRRRAGSQSRSAHERGAPVSRGAPFSLPLSVPTIICISEARFISGLYYSISPGVCQGLKRFSCRGGGWGKKGLLMRGRVNRQPPPGAVPKNRNHQKIFSLSCNRRAPAAVPMSEGKFREHRARQPAGTAEGRKTRIKGKQPDIKKAKILCINAFRMLTG